MARYAGVVVEAPLTTVYHYRIPPALSGRIRPGVRVRAPFGPRRIEGFCVSVSDDAPIEEHRIKELLDTGPEEVAAPEDILELTRRLADYYRCGWGEALAAAIPSDVRKGRKRKTVNYVTLAVSVADARVEAEAMRGRAPRQAAVLDALADALAESGTDASGGALSAPDIRERTGASSAAVRGLEKKGLVSVSLTPVHRELSPVSAGAKDVTLSEGQHAAVEALTARIDEQRYGAFLLYGATGSGKTEVYLRAMRRCLDAGRTAVVLVPEISLTPQTVERFRNRAGEVAVLHSNMAEGERAAEWRRLRSGEVRVAIGARSAVFAPLPDLGLVVVDEEHEPSFKQETTPRYHARDMAVLRGSICGATVVLGSATPSLESWNNARDGKYELVRLPERVTRARGCAVEVADMRIEFSETKKEGLLSRKLIQAVRDCLAREEQTILFLNRRGFNTWVHCLDCKEVLSCEQCDVSYTYHRKADTMRCHLCDATRAVPRVCPACGGGRLRFAGHGTERIEDVVGAVFPEARLLRMDSDTMTGRDSHAAALSAFARYEYDILLGTQMIAKGLDFPRVTVVGVLSADNSINLPDFRAPERTFQLITQVVGRGGRGDRPGKAVVQAFDPKHLAVRAAVDQDFETFAESELEDRRAYGYPPFGRLARILARGPDAEKTRRRIMSVAAALMRAPHAGKILGPCACPVAKAQGKHRFHMLVKYTSPAHAAAHLDAAGDAVSDKGGVKLAVDMDPVSML